MNFVRKIVSTKNKSIEEWLSTSLMFASAICLIISVVLVLSSNNFQGGTFAAIIGFVLCNAGYVIHKK